MFSTGTKLRSAENEELKQDREGIVTGFQARVNAGPLTASGGT